MSFERVFVSDLVSSVGVVRTGQASVSTGEVLRSVLAALEAVDHGARVSASHEERLEWVRLVKDVRRRVEGLATALVAEADGAGSSQVVAGTPLTSWLAQDRRVSIREATKDVLGAKDVASRAKVKAAALEGEIGVEQAKAITQVMKDLPRDLDDAQKELAEELLLVKAATTPAGSIRHLRRQVLEAVRPETGESREAEMRRLEEERRRAVSRRFLAFDDDGDGSFRLAGSLPYLEAQPFMNVVDAYVESQRRERRKNGTDGQVFQNARRADALVAMTEVLTAGSPAVHVSGGAGAGARRESAPGSGGAAASASEGSGASSSGSAASPGDSALSPSARGGDPAVPGLPAVRVPRVA
nr:DUF222 domain-containing protein [Actinomycetales bacterium]